MLVQVFE